MISGLENLPEDTLVFHAGTKTEDGRVLTSGGRVLNVVGTGNDLNKAIDKAYDGVKMISFEGMFYRKDIAKKGIQL
ncbi:MAG: phosphoribosylglycinamide synthetase C domain-containing protein [Calditrichaceae bacterium]